MNPSRFRICKIAFVTAACVITLHTSAVSVLGDTVTGGSLTFNLNGNAFANGADIPLLANAGVVYNTSQTFMEFAKHSSNSIPGRPAPSSGAGAVANFSQIRNDWVRPSSSGLNYDYNPNAALQTLDFNSSTVATSGAVGNIRFLGGDAFWYGNDPIIATGSIWLQYGDMDLSYDASRANGGNSGWFFRNNILAPLPIFDVRNPIINAAAGSFNISGELYTSAEFRSNNLMPFFIQSGLNVGNFSFSGTAVPEPTSLAPCALAALGVTLTRRRR
jgi:hypothetical protein